MILSFILGLCSYTIASKKSRPLGFIFLAASILLASIFSLPPYLTHLSPYSNWFERLGLPHSYGLPLSYPFWVAYPYGWGTIPECGLTALNFGNTMLYMSGYYLYTLGHFLTLAEIYLCLFLVDLTAGILGFIVGLKLFPILWQKTHSSNLTEK
jgi:hypothetical protein